MEEFINQINSEKLKKEILKTLNDFESLINFNYNHQNKYDLIHYANLLYFDTIPLKEFEILMSNSEKLLSIIKNPESVFESYFDKTFSEISNSNNNNSLFKNKFKQALRIQYNDIQKKIKECNEHIKELNELYIQEELYLKVPLTSIEKKKFILKNKNVLVYTQSSNKYGELFARYILSMIFSPQNSEYSLPDNFYDESKIFDFLYDVNQNVKPFNEWNNLLKYWIVYVLIYEKMFEKESNIDDITQIQPLFNLAKNIREYKSKGDQKQQGQQQKQGQKPQGQQGQKPQQQQGQKQQGQQQRGGGFENAVKKFVKTETKKKKEKEKEKGYEFSADANKYKELMKKIIIKKTTGDKSFNDIINNDTLENKIGSYYNINYIQGENSIPLIFDPNDKDSNIKLEKLISKKEKAKDAEKQNKSKEEIIKKLKEKIKIYQSLYTYKNTNQEEIKRFLNQLYKMMIYYYMFLYYKKKMIYNKYLEIFTKYLTSHNIVINNLVINNSNKNNQNKSNNNVSNSERLIKEVENENREKTNTFINKSNTNLYQKLSTQKKLEYKKIMDQILFLKKKKEELELNKNQINFDKKILIVEKLIHELFIEKHRILH